MMILTDLERHNLMVKIAGILGRSEIEIAGMSLTDTIKELVKVIEDGRASN